jgi:hypothetical protein
MASRSALGPAASHVIVDSGAEMNEDEDDEDDNDDEEEEDGEQLFVSMPTITTVVPLISAR